MEGSEASVVVGGAIAVVILREVFAFVKASRQKPNGHDRETMAALNGLREDVQALVAQQAQGHIEIMSALSGVREDTKIIRAANHAVVSSLAGMKGAIEVFVAKLNDQKRR